MEPRHIEDCVQSLWGSGCWPGEADYRSTFLTAVMEVSGSPYPKIGETIIKGNEYDGTQVCCNEAA